MAFRFADCSSQATPPGGGKSFPMAIMIMMMMMKPVTTSLPTYPLVTTSVTHCSGYKPGHYSGTRVQRAVPFTVTVGLQNHPCQR
eukprot:3937600-Rhodomonas_salina.1